MQKFEYVNVGNGLPSAPIINIKVAPPDWLNKTGEYQIEAFLDTGSDCTLDLLRNNLQKASNLAQGESFIAFDLKSCKFSLYKGFNTISQQVY